MSADSEFFVDPILVKSEERLDDVLFAAKQLLDNSEEYEFPEGMGKGADAQYWSDLEDAIELVDTPIDSEGSVRLTGLCSSLRAELAAEREKVRSMAEDVLATEVLHRNQKTKLYQQNALLTLQAQKYREALETCEEVDTMSGTQMIYDEVLVEAAINTTLDTAALDAYVAEKVAQGKNEAFEELAQQAEIMELTPDAIRYMAEAIAAQEPKA